MTPDQIAGILRAVLTGLGGIFLARGWVSAETWEWLVGGVLGIGPGIWSWFSNRPSSIAASAQGLQGVNVTTNSSASPEVTRAVANAKVA